MFRMPALCLVLLAVTVPTLAYQPHLSFVPDKSAERTAAQHAKNMVQFAQVELNLKLDWSDASIEHIEEISAELHADFRRERAVFGDIETLVDMLGSYVGEVSRRNHGGE